MLVNPSTACVGGGTAESQWMDVRAIPHGALECVRDHMGRWHRQDGSRPVSASGHWGELHAQPHRAVAPL
eukprot:8425775-Lingulodinium_polyedra.AAC.1